MYAIPVVPTLAELKRRLAALGEIKIIDGTFRDIWALQAMDYIASAQSKEPTFGVAYHLFCADSYLAAAEGRRCV